MKIKGLFDYFAKKKRREPRPLADKPSDLIEQAIGDLISAEKVGYTIDMGTWHEPIPSWRWSPGKKKHCQVCFAGAVMACSLNADPTRELFPNNFGPDVRRKLQSLDFFRSGSVGYGLSQMGITRPESVRPWMEIIPYKQDPDLFVDSMYAMAKMLREAGI